MNKTTLIDPNSVREEVRRTYGRIARTEQNGCCDSAIGCCSDRPAATAADKLGYGADEIAALPEGADLGLGCGNPQAIASLKKVKQSSISAAARDLTASWLRARSVPPEECWALT